MAATKILSATLDVIMFTSLRETGELMSVKLFLCACLRLLYAIQNCHYLFFLKKKLWGEEGG